MDYVESKATKRLDYEAIKKDVEAAKKAGLIYVAPRSQIDRAGIPKRSIIKATDAQRKRLNDMIRELDMSICAIQKALGMNHNALYNSLRGSSSKRTIEIHLQKVAKLVKQKQRKAKS
jgi:hypothetical protein